MMVEEQVYNNGELNLEIIYLQNRFRRSLAPTTNGDLTSSGNLNIGEGAI